MNTKESNKEVYEVIKFIEHAGTCRIVMDCAVGQPLIHRLREKSSITKEMTLDWFRMIAGELDQYHRCKKGQCYRYLNPYSILVTRDEKILLLDISAEGNAFVLKNLQKPTMREHFVKPVIYNGGNAGLSFDFYCMGKIMQFILAQMESSVTFTKREEYILFGVIEKCLGENPKRKYENMKQMQRELPKIVWKKLKKQ